MSDGGKGSSPRPILVDTKTYENNWDLIFNKGKQFPIEDNSGSKNDYQDILSTEDCVLDALKDISRQCNGSIPVLRTDIL